MRYALFETDICSATVAILIKERGFNSNEIKQSYIDKIPKADPKAFIAFSLWYDDNNKCPAVLAKEYLSDVLAELENLQIKTILVADPKYFKYLTGNSKVIAYAGYVVPSKLQGYEDKFSVIYIPHYQSVFYNPQAQETIDMGLQTLEHFIKGDYQQPGTDIIHSEEYPQYVADIAKALNKLHDYDALTVDIETVGLDFWECGLATIAFAWDEHNFISIAIDRGDHSEKVKKLLKEFFCNYKGKLILHNANFDFKVLTYELWMDNLQDYKGMIDGIETLTKNFEDTKIIAYLATNNAIENVLKLKVLAAPFAGNYAMNEITDTTKIDLPLLLKYNGIDVLATWFVYNKYHSQMITDDQNDIYNTIFKPSVITLLQAELFGMPIFPEKVQEAKRILVEKNTAYLKVLNNSTLIKEFHLEQQELKCKEYTEAAKVKVFTMDDPRIQSYTFNPNSNLQLRRLIYDYMGYEVMDTTDLGQPATGGKALKKLLNRATNDEHKEIFEALIGLAKADKILTSFIPAFEKAVKQPDGSYRLYGNFNLGGTVSGRLSSSNPNLTNIPSHSFWAKIIKECFGTTKGWLFGGADFNSLEDMVSALTTRDKNKMAVYLDGYDGHCLRAFYYFKDKMPDINLSVDSINSIETHYPELRQASKAPTFLLTYQGTYHGLMNNLGLDKDTAQSIEKNYHELYAEADNWVKDKIDKARIDGYVTGAFGLRLRTPLLKSNGKGKLGYKAAAESRTAGNMLGQSYGMLNSRAANEFRERVWNSKYRYDIFVCCQIHDATYIVWRNTLGITAWINKHIIECMQWCDLTELQHPIVKLGANLDIFYPNWAKSTSIPNYATTNEIYKLCH
jgi:DNA polymerase-1